MKKILWKSSKYTEENKKTFLGTFSLHDRTPNLDIMINSRALPTELLGGWKLTSICRAAPQLRYNVQGLASVFGMEYEVYLPRLSSLNSE